MMIDGNENNYPCSECGKEFFQKSKLERHKLSHTDECSLMCTVCGRGFKEKSNLYIHMKLHDRAKEYKGPKEPKEMVF